MILKKLTVNNFRQIAGRYDLSFAQPGSRNVTLVLGDNGSGKTTLLNSIRWCLYGYMEMENASEVVSHKAIFDAELGSEVAAEVALHFAHGGYDYIVRRVQRFTKADGGKVREVGQADFSVARIDQDEEVTALGDPQTFVSRLLPQPLADFFFFQGESILQLALQRFREELKSGVETFLDFRVLDRSVDHLNKVELLFEKELSRMASGDVKAFSEEIEEVRVVMDRLKDKREQERLNVVAIKADVEDVERELGKVEEFRPFLEESKKQEEVIRGDDTRRREAETVLKALISKDGYLAFESGILEEVGKLAKEAVSSGELPAKIKPQFVQELIDRGECVCGTELTEQLRVVLEKWKGEAGLAELEAAIQVLSGAADGLRYRMDDFRISLAQAREKVAKVDETLRLARELKSAADGKIQDIDFGQDYVKDLQRKLKDLQDSLVEHLVEVTRVEREEREKELERGRLERERDALLRTMKGEALVSHRIQASRHISEALVEIRTLWANLVQEHLDVRLKEAWEEVAQLPRRVSFSRDFALSIEEKSGHGGWVTSAPSEANCQVLALAFVSALIRFARELAGDERSFFEGGDFPLVMDAPFAKMDTQFKERVPKGLARAVPQMVVISSIDQWNGVVSEVLEGMVDRAFVLTLHRPGSDAEARTVRVLGTEVDYAISETDGFDSDWTALQEVRL